MKTFLVTMALCCAPLLLACGAPRCSASNCVGCCDANDTCQAGSTVTACGLSGSVCAQCLATACVNGFCAAVGGIGSSSGGGTGSSGGGSSGGGAGATGGGGGASPPSVRAYNLSIAGATLPASCFRNNVLPTNPPPVAARTLEVLVWNAGANTPFIALKELMPYQLGDSPVIRPPSVAKDLAWSRHIQKLVGDSYIEARQTQGIFTFADSTAASTTGTLALSSQFACVNSTANCPVGAAAPADAASCSLSLTFSAQEIPVTGKWTSPETPVDGSAMYLVAVDYTPAVVIAAPSCFRGNNLPVSRGFLTEQNVRELDVWQVFTIGSTTFLRTKRQTVNLGDAPTIQIDGDLSSTGGSPFTLSATLRRTVSGYEEVRSTSVEVGTFDAEVVEPTIGLRSDFACIAGTTSCPVGNMVAPDFANCQSTLAAVGVRLP